MLFKKRILTTEIAKWYEDHHLSVVGLEENGKKHGVQPPQTREAMVEIYHQIQTEEITKPTQIAWRVWERAKNIKAKHHEIATQIINRLQHENNRLKRLIAQIVVLGSLGVIALTYGLLLFLEKTGVLIK